jgi:hypothetical protein
VGAVPPEKVSIAEVYEAVLRVSSHVERRRADFAWPTVGDHHPRSDVGEEVEHQARCDASLPPPTESSTSSGIVFEAEVHEIIVSAASSAVVAV